MSGSPIEFDTALDLCRDQHRRIVLATLATERRPLTVNDLAKTILEHNHRVPVTEVSVDVLERIHISLSHVHIPMLTSAGVVEYDPDRRHVEPTEAFDQLQPTLSAIVDADPDLDEPVAL